MGDDTASAWPAPPRYYLEPRRAPPPPPRDGHVMYGVMRPPLGAEVPAASLEEQLYDESSTDLCRELRELNQRLRLEFLELLESMRCNTPMDEHTRKMRMLLLNMQHLINKFRPYQAREELIAIAQAQVDAKRMLLEECRDAAAQCAILNVPSNSVGDEKTLNIDVSGELEQSVDAAAEAVAASVAAKDARDEFLAATSEMHTS